MYQSWSHQVRRTVVFLDFLVWKDQLLEAQLKWIRKMFSYGISNSFGYITKRWCSTKLIIIFESYNVMIPLQIFWKHIIDNQIKIIWFWSFYQVNMTTSMKDINKNIILCVWVIFFSIYEHHLCLLQIFLF